MDCRNRGEPETQRTQVNEKRLGTFDTIKFLHLCVFYLPSSKINKVDTIADYTLLQLMATTVNMLMQHSKHVLISSGKDKIISNRKCKEKNNLICVAATRLRALKQMERSIHTAPFHTNMNPHKLLIELNTTHEWVEKSTEAFGMS